MTSEIWTQLTADPRVAANQSMRASHADRDAVTNLLGSAFAEGRLDAEEFDARGDAVAQARTLGDLLPCLSDLVTDSAPVSQGAPPKLAASVDAELRRRAEAAYRTERNNAAVSLMLGANLICWVIYAWSMVSSGSFVFPWPIFVSLGTIGYLGRTISNKNQIIEDHYQELLRKQLGQ